MGVDDESYNIPEGISFSGNSPIEEKIRDARSQYESIFRKLPTRETPYEEFRSMQDNQKLKASDISFLYLEYIYKIVHQDSFILPIKPIHQKDGLPKNLGMELYYSLERDGFSPFQFAYLLARQSANSIFQKYKIKVSTQFSSNKIQLKLFEEGDKDVIITTLDNLRIVDENSLTWEQVLELRNDQQSRNKYKRFIHWLDKEMIGKSQSFIEDEIAIKLSDYEEALKKHGIKTTLGTVKEMINSKAFLAGVGLSSLGIAPDTPLPVLIAGGSLAISGIVINVAEKLLAYKEVETGKDSEISWVYEVKQKSNKSL